MAILQQEKSENESTKHSAKPQRLPNGKTLVEPDHPSVRASLKESAAMRARLIAEGRLIEQPANASRQNSRVKRNRSATSASDNPLPLVETGFLHAIRVVKAVHGIEKHRAANRRVNRETASHRINLQRGGETRRDLAAGFRQLGHISSASGEQQQRPTGSRQQLAQCHRLLAGQPHNGSVQHAVARARTVATAMLLGDWAAAVVDLDLLERVAHLLADKIVRRQKRSEGAHRCAPEVAAFKRFV